MPTISIYLPDEDVARLNKIATDETRSASNAVSVLVREGYFKRYAVVSVDVAKTVDDETVVYGELDAGA